MNTTQNRIIDILKIKPNDHGQIWTYQIAIPSHENRQISSSRREILTRSFTVQGTNLIPVIVRRIETEDDDKEYEVVYGTDWVIIAEELNIEKLWVWVFNLTDDQVFPFKSEIAHLLQGDIPSTSFIQEELKSEKQINLPSEKIIEVAQNKDIINLIETTINNQLQSFKQDIINLFESKLGKVIKEEKTEISPPVIVPEKVEQKAEFATLDTVKTQKQNYSKMTVAELKELAKKRKISIKGKTKKDDIIEAIEKAEKS